MAEILRVMQQRMIIRDSVAEKVWHAVADYLCDSVAFLRCICVFVKDEPVRSVEDVCDSAQENVSDSVSETECV